MNEGESPAPDADAEDAARAADGDERAFERLYQRHVDRVYNLARRMIGSEEADDLIQTIFVRAWKKLDQFRGEAAFGTWLHQVAVNVIIDRRRQLKRERERDLGSDMLPFLSGPGRKPELGVDLEGAIEDLPDGAREILVLHDIEGYRHAEIAEKLEVSEGTSKSQLHRARMLIREHLTP